MLIVPEDTLDTADNVGYDDGSPAPNEEPEDNGWADWDPSQYYEVEKILGARRRGGGWQMLTKWQGYAYPTWNALSLLQSCTCPLIERQITQCQQDYLSQQQVVPHTVPAVPPAVPPRRSPRFQGMISAVQSSLLKEDELPVYSIHSGLPLPREVAAIRSVISRDQLLKVATSIVEDGKLFELPV